MQSLQSHGLKRVASGSICSQTVFIRHASLTSAINRGIRKTANTLDRLGTTPRNSTPTTRVSTPPRSRLDIERAESPRKLPFKKWGRDREPQSFVSKEAPVGIPYTTAGSEFLYGTFAVKAALEAKRRRLHKLYVWKGERQSGDVLDDSILKLARTKRIMVQEVAGTWDKMLMKMSGQRPHNGYVLEASPIPKLPIVSLGRMQEPTTPLIVDTQPQSAEDEIVNKVFKNDGSMATIPRLGGTDRYPLLLWLDRITDTGNLGAILRTAYFFGVDAIVIPEHGTAPFGPITVKASAGTAEYVPVLTVKKELDFVRTSKERGWKFFAAVAPDSSSTKRTSQPQQAQNVADELSKSPCILMVGNEGEGLRTFMQKAADQPISIEGVHKMSTIVDSLNVSVAAALLVARFMVPTAAPQATLNTADSDDSFM